MSDVVVLGSGFGGCLSALILQRIGLEPVVIDRATHPRFAIGESSTPIADRILRDLAARYALPRLAPLAAYGSWKRTYPHLGVGRKRGFSYFYHHPGTPYVPEADHANELLVAASAGDEACDTHWYRADVDAFFADEVRRAGIPLLDDTAVRLWPEDAGWRIEGTRHGAPVRLRTRFVLDATGAAGVVPRALGRAASAAGFRTHSRALFTHLIGVRRWPEMLAERGGAVAEHPFEADAAALHHVFDGGWMWQLRFDHGVVSAGFVLDARRRPERPGEPPEAAWQRLVAAFPTLREQLDEAAVAHPPGGIRHTGRLQRRVRPAAGPTWALLPHTAGFVDPLHSTGIAHTLAGIERLMRLLAAHWGRPTLGAALSAYDAALQRELDLIDALVAACYAASGTFRLYIASAMLYFAAVTSYEQARMQAPSAPDRLFLGADDDALLALVGEALARLQDLTRRGPATPAAVRAYEAFVETRIAPYNTVGLFHPALPNLYHHTAARP